MTLPREVLVSADLCVVRERMGCPEDGVTDRYWVLEPGDATTHTVLRPRVDGTLWGAMGSRRAGAAAWITVRSAAMRAFPGVALQDAPIRAGEPRNPAAPFRAEPPLDPATQTYLRHAEVRERRAMGMLAEARDAVARAEAEVAAAHATSQFLRTGVNAALLAEDEVPHGT